MKFKQGKEHINYKHGLYKSRIYAIWASMKSRCYCKSQTDYPYYGARGIKVCDEWKNDFLSFYNWAMSNGYHDDLTLDRINNDGNYESSNCRWVTMKTQANNRRNGRYLTAFGKTQHISDWAKEIGIDRRTLKKRIDCLGWPIEKALSTPIKRR